MPRSLTVSNGNLCVNFDHRYVLRDITWPHVGLWDHTKNNPWRFGVWVDGQFAWSDADEFGRKFEYVPDSLVTDVTLVNRDRLNVELRVNDLVHYRRDIFLRKITVTNPRASAVEVRLFFHHNPWLKESADANTVIYQPRNRSLVAYKDDVYIMANGMVDGKAGFHSYACGKKGVDGLAGTYADAEDGTLCQGSVAQGSVDSTGSLHFRLNAGESKTVYYWLSFATSMPGVKALDSHAVSQTPARLLDSTLHYWQYWVNKPLGAKPGTELCLSHSPACHSRQTNGKLADLNDRAASVYRRSLLTVRANSDSKGAILAALDGDILMAARDTYAYMWPRDGAFCAASLDVAGHGEVPRAMLRFCANAITEDGYFLHKYNPNGTLASSWHSMITSSGGEQLPIQEDETALILIALWKHYQVHGNTEFIYETDDELYQRLVVRAANFLASYRDPYTCLPKASYDLWEERHGIMAFTVATVYGGLKAAARLGRAVGDPATQKWDAAADEIKAAFEKHMYSESLDRFVRMVNVAEGVVHQDETIDSSMFAIWYFGLLPADDERVARTMEAIENRLWVKTDVGGIARYENDYYHQVSQDVQNVPGNPWIICTLWLAEWYIARAKSVADLARAREIIDWACNHTSSAELFAEQLHPYSGAPLSVAPLTWSHATFVLAVTEYVAKFQELKAQAEHSGT